MTARRLGDLSARERRREVARSVAHVIVAWVVFLGVFYAIPTGVSSSASDLVRVIIAVMLLGAVLAWQTFRIMRADFPELRAVVALGVVTPLFFVLFATTYLSMSDASGTTFTQGLDHTRALYFTITIFSTVGFGDITPATDSARLVVSAQMILGLILIGGVVKVLFGAAKQAAARAGATESDDAEPAP
jgi:voltage-gated potassium channel